MVCPSNENKQIDPFHFKNLLDVIIHRGVQNKNSTLYTFLKKEKSQPETLTFGELADSGKIIASNLQQLLPMADRVILLFPPGLEFIKAFIGCIYANIIPIPLPMPRSRESDCSHLLNVAKQANVSAIITLNTINIQSRLSQHCHKLMTLYIEELLVDWSNTWSSPVIDTDDIAFLQYTSGSTGNPKGVMVSHGNLLHNHSLIHKIYEVTSDSIFMSWLPHYHDMGLIGTLLQQIYSGCQTVLMSPAAFLQKPFRWLQAISQYKATISGGPNFAYELCIKRVTEEQKQLIDLSSWTIAFNGAEKIQYETIEKFSDKFSSCGFKKLYFFPTYGLAESTLLVTGGAVLDMPVSLNIDRKHLENNKIKLFDDYYSIDHQALMNSGKIISEQEIVIVNIETGDACVADEVGEIWVKGPSVTKGYWNNPSETRHYFQCYLSGGEGPYLKTGDMGFIKNNLLFVTGRTKDLIIIHGKNIYPEDIELTAQKSHEALCMMNGAAFAIEHMNQEQIVLMQEINKKHLKNINLPRIFKNISQAIMKQFDLQIYAIFLIFPHTLIKTTSGKIKRNENKRLLLENRIKFIAHWNFNNI